MLGKEMGYEVPVGKMQVMQNTSERIKINASYTLKGTVLDNVEKIKYLDITI